MCQSLQLSQSEQAKRHCVRLDVRNGALWKGLPPLGAVVAQDWGTYETCFARAESIREDRWHSYPILGSVLIGIVGFTEQGRRVMKNGSVTALVILDHLQQKRAVLVTTPAHPRAPWKREPLLRLPDAPCVNFSAQKMLGPSEG